MIILSLSNAAGHAVRHTLLEKGIPFAFYSEQDRTIPPRFSSFDFVKHPVYMVNQQLVVFDSLVMLEYLDERFPAPALMPIDPIARAQARLLIHNLYEIWQNAYDRYNADRAPPKGTERRHDPKHRLALFDELRHANEVFKTQPYILGNDLSLVDLVMFECLESVDRLYPDFLELLPLLQNYLRQLRKRPHSKRYVERFFPSSLPGLSRCAPYS